LKKAWYKRIFNPVNYCQYLVHSLKHVPSPTDKASWGGAPTERISTRNSTSKASWGGAPTERISTRNSTSKASWGRPSTERKEQAL